MSNIYVKKNENKKQWFDGMGVKAKKAATSYHNVDFLNTLKPKSLEDLVVHPKKISELHDCLLDIKRRKKQRSFLLINGPTGCGKTTTLELICSKLNIEIQEWINPVDNDVEYIYNESQNSRLLNFIADSEFPSLFTNCTSRICLIKDFPNYLIKQPENFEELLQRCITSGRTPIVFIVTETNSDAINLTKHLFTDAILMKFCIATINFNSCAVTNMKKVLKLAESFAKNYSDSYKNVTKEIVDAIVETSSGDIRNALNQYHLASLKGCADVCLVEVKEEQSQKRKRGAKTKHRLKNMHKDEPLGLFHGLGRVLNPKFDARHKPVHNIDQLVDEFSIQPNMFLNFLQANYLKYYGSMDDAVATALLLSDAEMLMKDWLGHQTTLQIALHYSVLGVMLNNRNKVSKWTQISAPKRIPTTMQRNDLTDDFLVSEITNTPSSVSLKKIW